MQLAGPMQRQLAKGNHALIPAGNIGQLAGAIKMLASARTMLLSSKGRSLAFQPSVMQGRLKAATGSPADMGNDSRATSNSGTSSSSTNPSSSSNNSNPGQTLMLLACSIDEGVIRRYDQTPLVAARHGAPDQLCNAIYARTLKQGYTSVRAMGPDALRNSVRALMKARKKLLWWGFDVAIVPAYHVMDRGDVSDPASEQEFLEYDDNIEDEYEEENRYLSMLTLHVVRCQPHAPWDLQPFKVPDELQPCIQQQHMQQQQEQKQQTQEQQQQQQEQKHKQHTIKKQWRLQKHAIQEQPTCSNGNSQHEQVTDHVHTMQLQPHAASVRMAASKHNGQSAALVSSLVPISSSHLSPLPGRRLDDVQYSFQDPQDPQSSSSEGDIGDLEVQGVALLQHQRQASEEGIVQGRWHPRRQRRTAEAAVV